MTILYRLIELIDGEKGPKLLGYKTAEQIKLWLLKWIF